MATPLPTRIRQNIRDHVSSGTSPLALKLAALKTVLGYTINLDPEWAMLWKSLQAHYPDSATFVPQIADTIITWCEAFQTWLESEENAEQVESLLDELRARSMLDLVLEITSASRPVTEWRKERHVFVIGLPSCPLPYRSEILAGFATDLISLFIGSPILAPAPATNVLSSEVDDPEEWAVLEQKPEPNGRSQSASHYAAPMPSKSIDTGADQLPTISSIPRPEELTKRPPYWLVVSQDTRQRITVQASHAPSLACLDEYLTRWCRGNTNRVDRPPIVEIRLQESAFGLGLLQDTLTLEAVRGREVSAMLILAFVENVLCYKQVNSSTSAGSVWEFKRTKGFK